MRQNKEDGRGIMQKQQIEFIGVIVHPGFGMTPRHNTDSPFGKNEYPPAYEHYSEYLGTAHNRQIDAKRFRKVLFWVWGKTIKELALAKNANRGLVIVPFGFEGKELIQLEERWIEMNKVRAEQLRFISFAGKCLGRKRLVVVRDIKEIKNSPEKILEIYEKRGLIR